MTSTAALGCDSQAQSVTKAHAAASARNWRFNDQCALHASKHPQAALTIHGQAATDGPAVNGKSQGSVTRAASATCNKRLRSVSRRWVGCWESMPLIAMRVGDGT